MKTLARTLSLLTVPALLLCGCATNVKTDLPLGEEIVLGRTSFSFDEEQAPYDLFASYRIKPGDVMDVLYQIRTWVEKDTFTLAVDHTVNIIFVHAPELNQVQKVRPDGTISLPYIGVVRVIDKSIDEITEELKGRYARILRNPDLYVLVPEFQSAIKELKQDLHTSPRGLSRLATVRPDGYITFPMLGDTLVAGRTVPEVNKELNERYEQILPGLHCDLFLERHSGTVIYVTGEVLRPGTYPINKPISVIEALSLSGSFSPTARLDSVMVVRRHEEKMVARRIDVRDHLDFTTESSMFMLQPDDIVIVPKSKLAHAAEVMQQVADVLMFRGWSVGVGFSYELHDAPEEKRLTTTESQSQTTSTSTTSGNTTTTTTTTSNDGTLFSEPK